MHYLLSLPCLFYDSRLSGPPLIQRKREESFQDKVYTRKGSLAVTWEVKTSCEQRRVEGVPACLGSVQCDLGSFSLFFCRTGKGKKCWKHEAEQSLSGAEEDESQVRVFGRHWGMRPLNDLRHEDHQELPCHVYSTTYCDKSLLFGNFMAPIYH